jgi:hypothetical protein
MSRRPFVSLGALVLIATGCGAEGNQSHALQPYFVYEEGPKSDRSDVEITLADVERMDDLAFEAVASAKADAAQATRYYAALTVAQRDAAALSYGAHQEYTGDLATITAVVTCQHFPTRCNLPTSNDPLSTELADLVSPRIGERLARDQVQARAYPPPADGFWPDRAPFKGEDAGSWAPWLVEDAQAFRLSRPPAEGSAADVAQLAATRLASQRALTDLEKTNIAFWAAGPGTKTTAGVWLQITEDRLELAGADLATALFVRSVVAMASADAAIAAMDSKYTWWARRPFMRDATLQTFLPTPNHPAYPSDSVTVSAAAARVLSALVPSASSGLDAMVDDAARSRIQSGLHFPIDIEAAKQLGQNVADAALGRAGDVDATP